MADAPQTLQEQDENLELIPSVEDFAAIADTLLKYNLHLAALELHTELLECGVEIPKLRDFFSNPGNFERQFPVRPPSPIPRTSSINTIDSLDDFARFSDDGGRGSNDERIAVLEFELRKAQDTIKALRGSLTEVANTDISSPARKGLGSTEGQDQCSKEEPIKPHEVRALDFLVNEYLLINNYRLTSVTFSEENTNQDFDDWDDVGLNIPKPPDLLHLYRDYGHHTVPEVVLVLQSVREEKVKLEEEVVRLNAECKRLREEVGELKFDNQTLVQNMEKVERDFQQASSPIRAVSPTRSDQSDNRTITPIKGGSDQTDLSITDQSIQDLPEISISLLESENGGVEEEDEREEDRGNCEAQGDVEENAPVDVEIKYSCLESGDQIEQKNKTNNTDKKTLPIYSSTRKTSPAFREALRSTSHINLDNRLAGEVSQLCETSDDLVLILARCLPHIVPNVLLNKREELIPVIICTAIHHPHAKDRDNLLHMLFNLIKRPDEEQRQMIMNGCAAFAQVVEPTRVEAELLPQWWEQITHKYHERRLLVAEACGVLSPYLPDTIRSSLVWSMLRQMLMDDRNEEVREAVTKSLGLVLAYMENSDKYDQAHELLMITLNDATDHVVRAAQHVLLPALADWSMDLNKLESHLAPSLLQSINKSLDDLDQVMNVEEQGVADEDASLTLDVVRSRVARYIKVFTSLVPALFAYVLRSAAFAKRIEDVQAYKVAVDEDRFLPAPSPLQQMDVIIGSDQLLALLVRRFDKYVTSDRFASWESLSWLQYECIPKLCDIAGRVHSSLVECVQHLMVLYRTICYTFGRSYIHSKLKSHFINRLNVLPAASVEGDDVKREELLSSACIPVLLVGVLGCFEEEEDRAQLADMLKDLIIILAKNSIQPHGPVIIYQELSAHASFHQLLIGVLWEIVVYQDPDVRSSAGALFMVLIKGVDIDTISRHVLPALVTLASDSHMSVRAASIPAFGAIVENVTDKTILEKVYVQFQSFLEDPQYKNQHELQVTMIRTFAKVGPHSEPHFRDEVLLPRLAVMASINNYSQDEDLRREIVLELFEAYVSICCCFISAEVLNAHVLPGIRWVRKDIADIAPAYEEAVGVLLQECEAKLHQKPFLDVPSSAQSSIGQDIKNTFMSGFHKLKDSQRPKMTDIFKRKERTDSTNSS